MVFQNSVEILPKLTPKFWKTIKIRSQNFENFVSKTNRNQPLIEISILCEHILTWHKD